MAIEAVVWDIGRVLVQWDLPRIWRNAIPDDAERARFCTEVVSEAWHFRHDAGEPMDAMVAERKAQFPQAADLIELYRTHWLEAVPGPIAGTHELVRALAARGMPQYAITNFGADTWAMFRPTFPVLDHMREIVVSGVERLVKPGREIFDLAAARFGHAPGAMLFIDDNPANVEAARALGWQAHLFADDGADALRAEFEGRGLL
ncbi:MAG: hypothetical protein RIS94_2335 [Pseudomonadota bacterium]